MGFKHHEIIREEKDGERSRAPYVYVGDLLLYLTDTAGKPYAVNWTVKKSAEDFTERRRAKVKTPVQQRKDQEHEQLRQILEEVYYQDAGIRTVRVSLDNIDSNVRANLDFLYGRHDLKLDIDPTVLSDFSCEIEEAVRAGDPVALVAIRYGARWGARDKFLSKIYKDIWERKLLVDLFRPILIDHPLEMQSRDALDVYGHLFSESPT
ncbi:transposase [Pseudomonas aeruginosa]